MSEGRKISDWLVFGGGVLLVLLLAAAALYACGYYALGTANPSLSGGELLRAYPAEWQAATFAPGAKVESVLRQMHVETVATPADDW